MPGISGLQLCELLETDYGRFDARKRRARALAGVNVAPAIEHPGASIVPVKSLAGWNAYDLEDVLAFGVALAGERAGLDYEDAARIATAGNAKGVLTHDPAHGDFLVGRVRFGGRTLHAGAPWSEWQAFLADEATPPDSLVTINASRVLRWVKERAATLGLSERLGLDPGAAHDAAGALEVSA